MQLSVYIQIYTVAQSQVSKVATYILSLIYVIADIKISIDEKFFKYSKNLNLQAGMSQLSNDFFYTFTNLTVPKIHLYSYSFISFKIVAPRLFIAFGSRHSKSFLRAFHVAKHQRNISAPYVQQPNASTLVIRSSLQLSIVKTLRREFSNEWMLYIAHKTKE